jgi:hypothetical protein
MSETPGWGNQRQQASGGAAVKRTVLALVAVSGGLLLTGSAAAVSHVRAEQRAAAADAAARADAAWADAVVELAAAVEVAGQPLQQALDLDLPGTDADNSVRYDVFTHGGVQADLTELITRLGEVAVPEPRREDHDGLVERLTRMKDTTAAMAPPELSDDEFDRLYGELVSATQAFRLATRRLGDDQPADPSEPLRSTTRAGMLYRWSEICARGIDQVEDLPFGDDVAVEQQRASLQALATSMEAVLSELLAVELVEADAPQLERDVRIPLRGLTPTVAALRQLDGAVGRRDLAATESALVQIDRGLPVFEQASRGLDAYGATTCAAYFDPGLLARDADDGGGSQELQA